MDFISLELQNRKQEIGILQTRCYQPNSQLPNCENKLLTQELSQLGRLTSYIKVLQILYKKTSKSSLVHHSDLDSDLFPFIFNMLRHLENRLNSIEEVKAEKELELKAEEKLELKNYQILLLQKDKEIEILKLEIEKLKLEKEELRKFYIDS